MFGLVADAPLMRPAIGTIAKAGKGSLRLPRSPITPRDAALEALRFPFQSRVGGDADHVGNAEKLAKFIEQGQSETSIGAQLNSGLRKFSLQSRDQTQQQGDDAGVTSRGAATQASRQQTARVPLEDQQGVIHVLAIAGVEKAQLLLSVSRIIGGIDIEQDLSALANLVPADLHKPIQQSIL
jgi:hypothetical protein